MKQISRPHGAGGRAKQQNQDTKMQAHIQFKNEAPTTIHVVMDHGRQRETIPGAGQKTFLPGVGDNPTYHVFNVDAAGNPTGEVYSDTFSTIRIVFPGIPKVGGDLKWTGSRIERD